MMVKKFEVMPLVILILVSIILAGCSKNPEPDVKKINNTNQAATAPNTNINQAATVSDNSLSQTSTTLNNISVPANPPKNPTVSVNNSSPPISNKKSSPVVKEPTPQISSGGEDMFLFAQVRGALSSDTELLNAVIIEIKEGNATLTGNVSTEAQKKKAEQLIQSVKGIKSVKNNLRVAS